MEIINNKSFEEQIPLDSNKLFHLPSIEINNKNTYFDNKNHLNTIN